MRTCYPLIDAQFSRILLALALLGGASAFAPRFVARQSTALNANIMQTVQTLVGPDVVWGSDGVLQGYEESDVKGQDTFMSFVQQVQMAGLTETLSSGEYTVFVPTDTAMAGKQLTPDQLKYHVVPGRVPKGSIGGDLQTLQGSSLTYKRFARQTFVDDAVVGMVPQGAATGSVYPVDVQCDNGLVHVIDKCLQPGWVGADAEAGLGGVN